MADVTKPMLVQWSGGSWYFGDITRAENHRSVLRITEHAVEAGPDVTDSARREVDRFSCEVLVSNTPLQILNYPTTQTYVNISPSYYRQPLITNLVGAGVDALSGLIFGAPTGQFGGVINAPNVPFDAVSDMRSLAVWLQDTKQLLTVTTPKAVYQNMLLEVSELNRQSKDGDAAPFRFEFKRVRVVHVGVTANISVPARGNAPKTKGKQGAQQQPTTTTPNSAAAQASQDAGWHQAGHTFGGP